MQTECLDDEKAGDKASGGNQSKNTGNGPPTLPFEGEMRVAVLLSAQSRPLASGE